MRWDCTSETSRLLAISWAAVVTLSSGRGSIWASGLTSGRDGSFPLASDMGSIVMEPAARSS